MPAPKVDQIINTYRGKHVAQVFSEYGVVAVTEDGKPHGSLSEAIAHIRAQTPEPAIEEIADTETAPAAD